MRYPLLKQIAWSDTHCDVITTGSKDRTFQTWQFDPQIRLARKPHQEELIGMENTKSEAKYVVIGAKNLAECQNYQSPIIASFFL
jgi:hypothetical protein